VDNVRHCNNFRQLIRIIRRSYRPVGTRRRGYARQTRKIWPASKIRHYCEGLSVILRSIRFVFKIDGFGHKRVQFLTGSAIGGSHCTVIEFMLKCNTNVIQRAFWNAANLSCPDLVSESGFEGRTANMPAPD